jgi:hypothetical protein
MTGSNPIDHATLGATVFQCLHLKRSSAPFTDKLHLNRHNHPAEPHLPQLVNHLLTASKTPVTSLMHVRISFFL